MYCHLVLSVYLEPSQFHLSFLLNTIISCICITFLLFIHQLKDSWAFSISLQLWIEQQWRWLNSTSTVGYRTLWVYYKEWYYVSYMGDLCLTSWEVSTQTPIVVAPCFNPINNEWGFFFPLKPFVISFLDLSLVGSLKSLPKHIGYWHCFGCLPEQLEGKNPLLKTPHFGYRTWRNGPPLPWVLAVIVLAKVFIVFLQTETLNILSVAWEKLEPIPFTSKM